MLDQKGMDRNLQSFVADLVDGVGAVSSVPFYPSLASSLVSVRPLSSMDKCLSASAPG